MLTRSKRRPKLGHSILIGMLALGYFFVFLALSQMNQRPWPSKFNLKWFARFLLKASGYYNIGMGNIPAAIEDCEALWRIARVSSRSDEMLRERISSDRCRISASELATAMVFSGKLSPRQLRGLLKARLSQPEIVFRPPSRDIEIASLKSNFIETLQADSNDTVRQNSIFEILPIFEYYRSHPQFVDWHAFSTKLDQLHGSAFDALDQSFNGELTYTQYTQLIDEASGVKTPYMLFMPKHVYYSIFGNQLLAMAKGPKSKGEMLAEISTRHFDTNEILFALRTFQAVNEVGMAIEVYKQLYSEYPKSLEMLTPELLAEIRNDPFSGKPLIYKRAQNGFQLYSVDRNMTDDGGSIRDLIYERPSSDLYEHLKSILN